MSGDGTSDKTTSLKPCSAERGSTAADCIAMDSHHDSESDSDITPSPSILKPHHKTVPTKGSQTRKRAFVFSARSPTEGRDEIYNTPVTKKTSVLELKSGSDNSRKHDIPTEQSLNQKTILIDANGDASTVDDAIDLTEDSDSSSSPILLSSSDSITSSSQNRYLVSISHVNDDEVIDVDESSSSTISKLSQRSLTARSNDVKAEADEISL